MKEILTAIGSTYAITSKNGCTVTYPNGDPIIEVPAGQQTLFIAQSSSILVSDEEARVTACGGSATLNFTSAAPSILSEGGSTGGLTANERALLMGAAQRAGDNTFTAANTFTGEVDMSTASVTPPEGWNVEGVTAEEVQAVVPMAWGSYTKAPTVTANSYVFGDNAKANGVYSTAIGSLATAGVGAHAIGYDSNAGLYGFASGHSTRAGSYCVSIGNNAKAQQTTAIAIGSAYSDTAGSYTCQTQGTGSITIGAGANTKNNGSTESSNSVTIGCKASNSGADSVVIGASASGTAAGSVAMGAGASAKGENSIVLGVGASGSSAKTVLIGAGASHNGSLSVAVGAESASSYGCVSAGYKASTVHMSTAIGIEAGSANSATSIGAQAKARGQHSIAIGASATVSERGAVVIRSTAEGDIYTQLYFAGANTPLATEYEGGEAMMGYVVRQKQSGGTWKTLAAGTQKLSVLFPNNSTFQPATVDENGEWVQPKVFHPSDLDMVQEEPSEPEEYQPLPVYPIVEPEIEEEI